MERTPGDDGSLRRVRTWRTALAAVALLAWAGCQEDEPVGPCYHLYKEPLFNIRAASSTADSSGIATLLCTGFTRDGEPILIAELLSGSYFVEQRHDTLICHVPCGFGRTEGDYSFQVGALGFRKKTETYRAHYQVFQGGCPSYNDGGLDLDIQLTPGP